MEGKCVSVRFEPFEKGKGVMSETTMEKPKSKGKGASPFGEHEATREPHATLESAKAHLEKHFGEHFAKEAPAEHEPGEEEEED